MLRVCIVPLLILAVALVACAPTTVIRRDIAERTWREVRSTHVTVYTDLDADDAHALVAEIEARRRALLAMYLKLVAPGKAEPTTRMTVIHLADCADLTPLWGDSRAGEAQEGPDFERRRTALTCQHEDAWWRREVLAHELTHLLSYHFFPSLPVWLEEGLAEYFQTLSVEDGELVLGQDSRTHARQRHPYLPPLRELLGMEPEALYALREHGYIAAWRLVHLLATSSDDYAARFARLLAALGNGVTTTDAWEAAFGDVPLDRLEHEYRDYLRHAELGVWTAPHVPPRPTRLKVRALSRSEAHDVWMRALVTFSRTKGPDGDAARYLALADKDMGGWPEAGYWKAVLAWRAKDPGAALDHLRAYTARHPEDARGWLGLVETQLRLTDEAPTGAELDELTHAVAELQRRSRSARALDAIAGFFALRGPPATGLGFARRAVAADASCIGCEATFALLLFQDGQHAEAVRHQMRAVRLAADAPVAHELRAQLRRYREAASRPAR